LRSNKNGIRVRKNYKEIGAGIRYYTSADESFGKISRTKGIDVLLKANKILQKHRNLIAL
jgi:hypothetical protein